MQVRDSISNVYFLRDNKAMQLKCFATLSLLPGRNPLKTPLLGAAPVKTFLEEAEAWGKAQHFTKVLPHDEDHVSRVGRPHGQNFISELYATNKTFIRNHTDSHGTPPSKQERIEALQRHADVLALGKTLGVARQVRREAPVIGANNTFVLNPSNALDFTLQSEKIELSPLQLRRLDARITREMEQEIAINGEPEPGKWVQQGGQRLSIHGMKSADKVHLRMPFFTE
jgi:hypothetical protein